MKKIFKIDALNSKIIFIFFIICLIILSIFFTSCNKKSIYNNKQINVLVSILPIKGVLYNIIKNDISKYKIEIIIDNPIDHHNIDFSSNLINKLNYSNYVLSFNSLELEKELSKKIDSNKLVSLYNSNYISNDPHVWLSLKNLKNIYLNTYNFLYNIDKVNINYYKNNLNKTLTIIELYHNYLSNKLKKYEGKYILTYHNEYYYFARDYYLNIISYQYNETEPSLKELQNIVSLIKNEKIAFILSAPYYDNSVFNKLLNKAKKNIKIIVLNPFTQNTLQVFWEIYSNI